MTPERMRPTFALLMFLLLAACSASPAPSAPPSGSALPATSPSAHPTSPTSTPAATPAATLIATPFPSLNPLADTAIVRVDQAGGMLPPWETLRFYPSVALYGDGRLITQGPMIEIYPGPALPNLQVTQLTQAGVQQVLAWAEEAGLHGPDRQLGEPAFDSGTTEFVVVSADGTHRTSVADMAASDLEVGAVRQFQDIMMNLRAWLPNDIVGDDVAYDFDRLRIISSVADPATIVDPELSSTVDWPLDTPLGELGVPISEPESYRCAVVEGEHLDTLMPLLQQANELTLWQSAETLYQLRLRPLLPDEEPCPGV